MMEGESENLTIYRLIDENGDKIIKATSNNSAGRLIYKIRIDPNKYPVIEWRWKVS